MHLEKLIKKLKEAPCMTKADRKNIKTNIAICEMQIKIRDERVKN